MLGRLQVVQQLLSALLPTLRFSHTASVFPTGEIPEVFPSSMFLSSHNYSVADPSVLLPGSSFPGTVFFSAANFAPFVEGPGIVPVAPKLIYELSLSLERLGLFRSSLISSSSGLPNSAKKLTISFFRRKLLQFTRSL